MNTTPQSADNQGAVPQQSPDQDPVPYMTSMATCMNKMVLDGYVDTFKVTEKGLHSLKEDRYFNPEDVKVINFFRFEGVSDPADNTILYQIQTADGLKGSLVDAYGPYSDAGVNAFMKQVEDIEKKNPKKAS
jgi:hypothetical protein